MRANGKSVSDMATVQISSPMETCMLGSTTLVSPQDMANTSGVMETVIPENSTSV